MTAAQQESWLVSKYTSTIATADLIKKMLGQVRGGQRIVVREEDERSDLIDLKK